MMKKILFLMCACLTMLLSVGLNAQSVSTNYTDYFGTWKGVNSAKEKVVIALNSDWTFSITVDGENQLTGKFKLNLENSIATIGVGSIDVYQPYAAANPGQQLTFVENQNDVLAYSGILVFDGNELKIQLANGSERPTQFDNQLLLTLTK